MISNTVRFTVLYEISENFLRGQIEAGTLPDRNQLQIFFFDFDHYKKDQDLLIETMMEQQKQIESDHVSMKLKDEKDR